MYITRHLIAASVLGVVLSACNGDWRESLPRPIERDLADIRERDTLAVLTTYNSTSYFLYRGQPMGYEYELLKAFAEDQDIHLKMEVLRTRDSIYQKLNTGEADIVADRVVPMAADSAYVAFTRSLYETQPVLVQRKQSPADSVLPEAVDTIVEKADGTDSAAIEQLAGGEIEVSARLVRKPSDLAGEHVDLPYRSDYTQLLVELADTLTGDIEVVELDTVGSYETVIRHIASGAFDYTVAPGNLARLKQDYFDNIRIRPTMGAPHKVAWAVRTNAPDLREALNTWIEENGDGPLFEALYQKYFVDRRGYRERRDSGFLTGETGRLSDYDGLLRRHSESLGWDWLLLASQTYQESKFQPRARSWAGAAGLLQLMPPTAREFGVANVYDPDENVAGAVRFLQWLTDYWKDKIEDEQRRLKFILASYNTGHGHVEDARRLAEKNGGDAQVWADVAYWLLQKSKRSVYQDPVVKYGFCRGLEPVTYVSFILDRYDHYKEFVTEQPTA